MNTNSLQGIRCPQCGNTDAFEVGVRLMAIIIDSGVDTIRDATWEDDAPTRCIRCDKQGDWKDFRDDRAFNRCVNCGVTIFWDKGDVGWNSDTEGGLICDFGDELTSTPAGGHMPMWLTLAEFRHLTRDLPDKAPLTVYINDQWQNLRLTPEDVDYYVDESNASVVLTATDDFDTRQW